MLASAQMLIARNEFNLCVVTASSAVSKITKLQGKNILYYVIPVCRSLNGYETHMKVVNQEYKPDLIHVHGTELPYGLACVNVCHTDKVVVSIQGVMSEIAKYYYAGLSRNEILKNITLRDIFRGSLIQQKRLFEERGEQEKVLLRKVRHAIGRTSFDKAHVLAINPNLQYHFCNETLRPEFYTDCWEYNKCIKHSIFLSQTRYPVKGAHILFNAIHHLIEKYPDLKVYIAGNNIVKGNLRLSGTGYGLLLKRQIKRLGIEKNLGFVGALTAEEMKEALLKANVFVCPSSIENSSNSLAEAQMLGVPIISSYVGGLPDFIPNTSMGKLYRFEDETMLSFLIEEVFETTSFDNAPMRQTARTRHDPTENIEKTVEIYNSIMNADKDE